jgi:hypothetical protein
MTQEKKLIVNSMEQKIIFYCEMEGQISDGQWENATPHDHYKAWCLKWDEIEVRPNKVVGRNFYAVKDNYNFSNWELLEVVGDRILTKINLYRMWPSGPIYPLQLLKEDPWCIPDSAQEYFSLEKYWATENEYWAKKLTKLKENGITLEIMFEAEKHLLYTHKDLIRDCDLLKLSCRNFIWR